MLRSLSGSRESLGQLKTRTGMECEGAGQGDRGDEEGRRKKKEDRNSGVVQGSCRTENKKVERAIIVMFVAMHKEIRIRRGVSAGFHFKKMK